MLYVKSITKKVHNKVGVLRGKPIALVQLSRKEDKKLEMDLNDILDKIKACDTEYVVIEGNDVSGNGSLKELCIGLSTIHKKVNLVTHGMDDIEVIRMYKNILITFNCLPPTKDTLGLSKKNLFMLRENDEIKFLVQSKKDFEAISVILTNNVILRPIFYLVVTDKVSEEERAEIIDGFLTLESRVKTDLRLIY